MSRCKRIPGVDEVVCAIPPDAPLLHEAARYCKVVVGPERDVLERYWLAANRAEADIVVRITGDCPLISPELCGDVLADFKSAQADYGSNILPRTFPKGFDCEVFTAEILGRAYREAKLPADREHVTPWIQTHAARRSNTAARWVLDGRLTLDTWDDYAVICAAFGHEADQRLRAA